ncbi:membrane-spanning 4-domains subfamily A member 6C-like [Macrotis lagotis]|uniref:membrane-spanning 4-domains subfamily A member 6C-like n=1 Tax=Macrotis lagotis TaxID=92651 RepID=UPI003D68C02A
MDVHDYFHIQEEIRILGTLQINIGIFHLFLGSLRYYIQMTYLIGEINSYKTYILKENYPVVAAVTHIISGTFVILTEKKSRRSLAKLSGIINIIGVIYSIYGMIILITEFLSYGPKNMSPRWPEQCKNLLSNYLFIYTSLYIFVCCIILKWNYRAIFGKMLPFSLEATPRTSAEDSTQEN